MSDSENKPAVPVGNLEGFRKYAGADLKSGFFVFLIALPLCLGISSASNFPAIAGIFTAIVGGIVCTFLSNSELTIKGPAAGLIVVTLGCIMEFARYIASQQLGIPAAELTAEQITPYLMDAYKMALAVGVAAGLVQIFFSVVRFSVLMEMVPISAVHGMLAAIGIIIAAKQFHTLFGVLRPAAATPFGQILEIPHSFMRMDPEIFTIGLISLIILFGLPFIKSRYAKIFPAQMIVLLVAVPLGMWFELDHEHTYSLFNHDYTLGLGHLVTLRNSLFESITLPDFSALATGFAWKWVAMYALVGSLESLLSAKAIDLLDPHHRRTNMTRDLLAVGIANTIVSFIGGLPMISEIVRSSANKNNGAQTRFANLYHGLFLLLFIAAFPMLIQQIPLAALAAMLIYTGYRLASPREWYSAYKIGVDQFLVFAVTVVVVVWEGLLEGVAAGIAVKFLIHLWNYLPLRSLFLGDIDVEPLPENKTVVRVRYAAVFSNWLSIKSKIDRIPADQEVIIDLSATNLIDHTVMEKLHEMEHDFELNGRKLSVVGMQDHQTYSQHPYAARKKGSNGKPPSAASPPSLVPPAVANSHDDKPAETPAEPAAH